MELRKLIHCYGIIIISMQVIIALFFLMVINLVCDNYLEDKTTEDNIALVIENNKGVTENGLYSIHNLETKYDSNTLNTLYKSIQVVTIMPQTIFEEGMQEPVMASRILDMINVISDEEEQYILSDTASIYDVTEYDDGGYRVVTVDDIYPYINAVNDDDKYRTEIYYSDNDVIYGIVFYRYEERN